jgi:hypothetical protein
MVLLGQQVEFFELQQDQGLAGCGIQTAALAIGGSPVPGPSQHQQKNMMDLLGQHGGPLNTARTKL